MNLAQFPRRGYVTTPTPIEYCPNFSKALGADIDVYIKRDDMLPGTAGGNKTRKLDFCIADALQKGCDTVITCGAVQSNHCRLTLSWAVHEGMDCHLVLEERVKGSYNPEASGNNFLFQLLGVKSITVVPGGSTVSKELEACSMRQVPETSSAARGLSGGSRKKLTPKRVSARVVKTVILRSVGVTPSSAASAKSISAPSERPIQLRCCALTFSGQPSSWSRSSRSSWA